MEGSCHCGAARWRFEGVPQSATSCNCSICRRHGALWAYGVQGEDFTVSGETATYLWNRRWLAFHFCAKCACVVAWLAARPGQDGRVRGAVNLRLAAGTHVRMEHSGFRAQDENGYRAMSGGWPRIVEGLGRVAGGLI